MKRTAIGVVIGFVIGWALIALFGCEAGSQATTDTVSWTHPTQRTDNTALPIGQIKHTMISWGTQAGGPYTAGSVNVAAPAATAELQRQGAGTRCYVAFTVDTQDRISAPSNEACKTITSPPNAPAGLTAT